MCVCVWMHTIFISWYFHCVVLRDQIQVFRLSGKHLYLVSHLARPEELLLTKQVEFTFKNVYSSHIGLQKQTKVMVAQKSSLVKEWVGQDCPQEDGWLPSSCIYRKAWHMWWHLHSWSDGILPWANVPLPMNSTIFHERGQRTVMAEMSGEEPKVFCFSPSPLCVNSFTSITLHRLSLLISFQGLHGEQYLCAPWWWWDDHAK